MKNAGKKYYWQQLLNWEEFVLYVSTQKARFFHKICYLKNLLGSRSYQKHVETDTNEKPLISAWPICFPIDDLMGEMNET